MYEVYKIKPGAHLNAASRQNRIRVKRSRVGRAVQRRPSPSRAGHIGES